MVSLVLVDGEHASRDFLGKNLGNFLGLKIKTARDFATARTMLDHCDLLLVSASLANDGAYQLLRIIQREHPRVRAVVLDPGTQTVNPVRFYEAGAYAFVCISTPPAEMYELILRVHRGEAVIQPSAAAGLLHRLSELSAWLEDIHLKSRSLVILTRREREVLSLIGRDYSNQDIANTLFIEVGTVKNHVHRILAKLNVSSRREAANLAGIQNERSHRQQLASW